MTFSSITFNSIFNGINQTKHSKSLFRSAFMEIIFKGTFYFNFIPGVTNNALFCIFILVVFWVLQPGFLLEAPPLIGVVFYVWVGMFGVFVVAQVWTFCVDVYTDERGKRLLPMIAIGATSGAVAGSRIVSCGYSLLSESKFAHSTNSQRWLSFHPQSKGCLLPRRSTEWRKANHCTGDSQYRGAK